MDTTFVNGTTLTDADWFNDVNRLHYTIFADAADTAAARDALGVEIGVDVPAYGAAGSIIQSIEGTPYATHVAVSVVCPVDNTIPQKTEGFELVTVTITPTNASNRLRIEWGGCGAASGATVTATAAIFQDATANALAAAINTSADGVLTNISGSYEMAAGTTSATTFKLLLGVGANSFCTNGIAANRLLGGVLAWRLRVTEIAA